MSQTSGGGRAGVMVEAPPRVGQRSKEQFEHLYERASTTSRTRLYRSLYKRFLLHHERGHDATAERFGIGVATAVRWLRTWHETGATAAKPEGGDRRSHRIAAFGGVILDAIEVQVPSRTAARGEAWFAT